MKRSSQNQKQSMIAAEPISHAVIQQSVIEQNALEHIREAAFYKWQQAGGGERDGTEFWLAAECEYLTTHAMPEPSDSADLVQEASEESFPASDPPARSSGRVPATAR